MMAVHKTNNRYTMKKGTKVKWNWGKGTAEGKVTEKFTKPVTRTIKGSKIKRNATEEKPAYLVEQQDGDKVLKSESELTKK